MDNSSHVAVKVSFYGEIHRVQVDIGAFTLKDLHQLFNESFKLPAEYAIRYTDNEGDVITVSNDSEFVEACRVFLRLNGEMKTLHFTAVCSCPFKDKITPIVKAVEDMAECVACAANDAIAKAKSSEFQEKCRQHAQHTAECAQKTAKQTGEYLANQGRRLSESEMAQKVKDFAIDVKRSVNELIENTKAAYEPENTNEEEGCEGNQKEEAIIEEEEQIKEDGSASIDENPELIEESQTESSSVASQEEWDIVNSPKSVRSVESEEESAHEQENAAQDEVLQEDLGEDVYEGEWAEEVKIIREMLPHIEVEQVLELLERFHGSIHVVINELMDM